MSNQRASQASDPQAFVDAPVVAALNRIGLLAVGGFAVVAGFATVPLILRLEGSLHEAFHFLVPIAWVAFASCTFVVLQLRPAPAEPDVWTRAAEVDAGLVRFVRRLSLVMGAGWLAAFGAVMVHHHLSGQRDILYTVGVIGPLTLAAWILAVVAFGAWCRAMLARAEVEAAGRLRRYWSEVGERQGT